MMVHEMFSPERIEFNRECTHHEELCLYLVQLGANTEAEVIGAVAGYLKCDIDGAFTPDDMAKLYAQFTVALKQDRVQGENAVSAFNVLLEAPASPKEEPNE